jgi:hypothetical protein
VSTDYRQGQGPFGGDVRPGGNVLMLQEEFEAGAPTGGTPFGPRGTAAARLQDRWRNWNPATLPAQIFRWLDPIAQRFSLYAPGPVVVPETNTCRWVGNVLRIPPFGTYAEPPAEDGTRRAWLTAFAGVSAGPGQALVNQFTTHRARNFAALVVSSADLSVTDAPFSALGLQQHSDPLAYAWKGNAFFANWNTATDPPSTLQGFELGALGALFRLDMLAEFTPAEGDDPAELITQLIGFVSNDGGRGWTYVGSSLLKGPTDINAPATIGFGASSTSEPEALPNPIEPIECTGGFDFLRVYQQPFNELNILLNPDGGRNWP